MVKATTNNGIRGYIIENDNYLNDAQTLSFAQDTFTVFYQKEKYYTGNKVKVLKPIFAPVTEKILRFIVACFQCSLQTLSWGTGSTVSSIEDIKVGMPTNNGEIDFDFMENFVAELEARRVAELEAYLLATGLKDYTLTEEEENVLEKYNTMSFGKFAVTDVFDIKNTSNILSCDITENSGETPYLCASAENNSVSSYISYNKRYIEEGNCIFIGGKTFVVSWQKDDFFSNDSHNLALYYKGKQKDRLTQLFLAACIKKSLCHKYSWGNSISKSKIKEDYVDLPVKDCELDLQNVKTLISAIQKLVIKDVVLYADRKIAETKNILQKR